MLFWCFGEIERAVQSARGGGREQFCGRNVQRTFSELRYTVKSESLDWLVK